MKDSRRLYLNNWALLTKDNAVTWHFGEFQEDNEKLNQTADFVAAMSKLGDQILSQGVGIIRLRYPRPHPTNAREILVVNLLNKYNIVVSDPLVTTRMMNRINVDQDIIDEMRSILAGSASVIYSQLYSAEEEEASKETIITRDIVDTLFQEAVQAITFNTDKVTVGGGECSFSALSLEELLFMHTMIRRLFENYAVRIQNKPWGVVHAAEGVPLYLEYRTPVEAALISAFSSVIMNYCRLLFEAYPARLVFGAQSMNAMDFIATDRTIFVTNSPSRLLRLQKVARLWRQLPPKIAHDLAEPMKDYFIELALREEREKLRNMEFHQVINRLTKMGIHRARDYQLPPIGD